MERLWAEEEFSRGCYGCYMTTGRWTGYGEALRAPIGPLHWASTETAEVWSGYMDGAVRAGEAVAQGGLPRCERPVTLDAVVDRRRPQRPGGRGLPGAGGARRWRCCERRDIVGGACVTEELWPGVRASPGAYTLSLLRPEIIRELELGRHGLHVDVHEPGLFAPFPDGRHVVTWSSRERTRDGIERGWSRADADAYAEFVGPVGAGGAARPPAADRAARSRALAGGGRAGDPRRLGGRRARAPSRRRSVRVPFAIQGLIGTLAGPDDPGTAFVGFYHDLGQAAGVPGAWGYARGGMGAVTAALRGRRRGGGRAGAAQRRRWSGCWWRTAAPRAWCSRAARRCARGPCSPTPTRCARPAWPGAEAPDGWRQAGPVVKVMVLLDGPARLSGDARRGPWRGAIDIGFTMGDLSARPPTTRARAGPRARPGSRPRARPRPTTRLRPAGRHVVSMFCQCFPPEVDAEAAADSAIARLAEVCPGFPDRIVDRLALGPRELEERFGITGGHIFHGEMLPGQLLEERPDRRALRRRRAPLPGRLGRPPRRRGDRRARAAGGAGVLEDLVAA